MHGGDTEPPLRRHNSHEIEHMFLGGLSFSILHKGFSNREIADTDKKDPDNSRDHSKVHDVPEEKHQGDGETPQRHHDV